MRSLFKPLQFTSTHHQLNALCLSLILTLALLSMLTNEKNTIIQKHLEETTHQRCLTLAVVIQKSALQLTLYLTQEQSINR